MTEWHQDTNIPGPEDYGATLHIDDVFVWNPNLPVSLDIETDEDNSFVGAAICQTEKDVYYFTDLEFLKGCEEAEFIMQGGKFDIRELKSWDINVNYDNLVWDTKIMAYSYDTTLPSYSLKKMEKGKRVGLIEQFLPHLKWPTYKEMVLKGRTKVTLDKQSVERTAKYCGMDALATFKLYKHLLSKMSKDQLDYYNNIEMPIYRLLARMEDKGIKIDKRHLSNVGEQLLEKLVDLERTFEEKGFNPRSPKQLLEYFKNKEGLKLPKTDINTLKQYEDLSIVKDILNYRKYKKIHSTYVVPYLEQDTDRIHCNFTQSTITGRLASSSPNIQNIPSPDPDLKRFPLDTGTMIRKAFIADEGHRLLCLDYSQIEYRLFAHFSKEPVLLEAFKNGKDVHKETARAIGLNSRRLGKTINFAAIYGAQAKRIAQTAGINEEEAEQALKEYWKKLPRASAWIAQEKFKAKKYEGITTMLGRFIPLPKLKSDNKWDRLHWERVAINAIIQGSASEIIKLAMLEVDKAGSLPVIQEHDSLVFNIENDKDTTIVYERIKSIMENVVRLDVPLIVDGKIADNWAEAK